MRIEANIDRIVCVMIGEEKDRRMIVLMNAKQIGMLIDVLTFVCWCLGVG